MDGIDDILGLEDLIGQDGQIAPPRRGPGRPAKTPAERRAEFKASSNALFAPKATESPITSWWVGLTREQLAAKAAARFEEMQKSKFGRMKGNIPESPMA